MTGIVRIMRNQSGFTLLEAIVALVLIATTGMALLSWVNTNLISLGQVQQVQKRHEAMRSALAFMKMVNPLEMPLGEEVVGIYKFSWKAKAVVLPKDGVTYSGNLSNFQVGLYNTIVEISVQDSLLTRFTLRQIGFKSSRI